MKIYDYAGRRNVCGPLIRKERKKRHLSQTDLAARMQVLGVTLERDSVSRIELGTRFVADYELMVIADILSVPVHALLPDTRRGDQVDTRSAGQGL